MYKRLTKRLAKRIAAIAFMAILAMPTFIFAGTTGGTAQDPIQAKSSERATIYLGKVLDVSQDNKFPTINDFVFKIDNIKAWDNANVSAGENGIIMTPAEMPQPVASDLSHHQVSHITSTSSRVRVGDFMGDANSNVSDTAREKYRITDVHIDFAKAGYYMYKVYEDRSEQGTETVPGMSYDDNSYYIVVYVCNKTDANGNTIDGVYVHDITSYRNDNGSTNNEPDLTDIQQTTDNNNQAAVANNYSNFGKVGISDPDPGTDPESGRATGPNKLEAYRFYNDLTTHDVVVTNNVTGNLGDVTKEFEYIVTLTGLEKDKVYTTNDPAQDKTAANVPNMPAGDATSLGADMLAVTTSDAKGTVDSTNRTFTSDSDGNATFMIKLADDETIVFNALPASSTYQIKQLGTDHVASFTSESTEPDKWVMAEESKANAYSHRELDTAQEIVDTVSNVAEDQRASDDNDGTVTISFKNHRDLVTPTGLPYYGDFVYVLAALVVAGIAFALFRRRRNGTEAE